MCVLAKSPKNLPFQYLPDSSLHFTMTHLSSESAVPLLKRKSVENPPQKGMHKDALPPVSYPIPNAPLDTAIPMLLTPENSLEDSANSSIFAVSANVTPAKIDLLGMDFDNFSKQELLSNLQKGVVFTPNVDHLMKLRRDPDFVSVYQKADFKVCDSQVLMYASKFLGKPLKAKLSGSDLFPWFCEYHKHNESIEIFLLGGREGVACEAQKRINERTGRRIIVGEYSPPYGFESDPKECDRIVELIKASTANVLVVCLGAPKQEKWIATYRDRLPNIDIFMAVGAAVDFEAGCKPRAPQYVSELGLEWLYRLVCEPRRLWRRYLVEGMPFVGLVLIEKAKQMIPRRASKA